MEKAIRVLIIEDNLSTCALVSAFLEKIGSMELCAEAHNGQEGLMMLRQCKPDLVLLDLIMPEMDGLSFLEALRNECFRPKVVVLSGVGTDEFVQRSIQLGASYYLMKPVRLDELAARLQELFPETERECDQICQLLLRLGANRDSQGFRFACRGVELLREQGESIQLKAIYHGLAEEFSTTWSCVERNLRTTIRQIHSASTSIYMEGLGFADQKKQPDNGAFLRALARIL